MTTTVRIDRADEVWTVTIDRPEVRNAVDGPTARALADAFRAFDTDPRARVAVLTGAGGHFCAGADLRTVASGSSAGELGAAAADALALALDDDMDADGPMGPSRLDLSKPVIAAVEGYAVAGGLELAVWCDLRVAATNATFGVFCRRFGVPLIDGGTVRLPRLIGESRAMDLILTGRAVGAEEALALGLANRVVAEGEALPAALQLARQIAAFPPHCLRNDRLSARRQHGLAMADALAQEFALGRKTLASGEAEGGAQRFVAGAGKHGRFGGS
jgi:enoyl-CoA hydratase